MPQAHNEETYRKIDKQTDREKERERGRKKSHGVKERARGRERNAAGTQCIYLKRETEKAEC